MDNSLTLKIRQVLVALVVLVAAVCLFSLLKTIIIIKTTGLVRVDASIAQATISVSQDRHEAKVVGTGTAKIRLKPGLYQIRGYVGHDSATKTIKVNKGDTAKVSLELGQVPRVRSVDDVDFNGISRLTNSGLSEEQTTELQLAFFRFNTAAEVVAIDGDSYSPGARDSARSIGFTATFSVTMDSKPYKANISWTNSHAINLRLNDAQANTEVFNSDAGATAESD